MRSTMTPGKISLSGQISVWRNPRFAFDETKEAAMNQESHPESLTESSTEIRRAEIERMEYERAERERRERPAPVATITQGGLSLWQAIGLGVTLCLTVGGIIWSGVQGVRQDINGLRQDMALVTQRVATLEEKDRYYDRLVDARNQQMLDIQKDIATIQAILQNQQRQDREGRGR